MSPHNNTRFNGSNLNSKSSYHNNQNELGLAMERLLSHIRGLLYTYSGLRSLRSRRIFKRGIQDNQLTMPPITDGIRQ